ncbi:MAG: 2'-5' RNA ligase family protein [Alphaproteobacteria bacterium]|jgi:2'-5' RNA ligase|nr:2'-5' RNA ligase family protein [Alphaproteobacteria bacterium]
MGKVNNLYVAVNYDLGVLEKELPFNLFNSLRGHHTTIIYIGESYDVVSIEIVLRYISICYYKFKMRVDGIYTFYDEHGYNFLAASINSLYLGRIRTSLAKAFDKAEIRYSMGFGFNPHITFEEIVSEIDLNKKFKDFRPFELKVESIDLVYNKKIQKRFMLKEVS